MKFIQVNYSTEYYFKVPSEVNLDDENIEHWVKWNTLNIIVYKPNLTPEQKQDKNNILRKYQIEPSNDGNEDMKWPEDEVILDSEEDDFLECFMTEEELEQEGKNIPVDDCFGMDEE